MIYLFTDFGTADLYVGQVKAELARHAPGVPVIDLLHEAPAFGIAPAAHLLAALALRIPAASTVLAVVDPGVGTRRKPIVVHAAASYFVGPDNGLLSVLAARAERFDAWEIAWRPQALSRSFHGRDLFAPIAARLALGIYPSDALHPCGALDVTLDPSDLAQVIYIDHYGNVVTGLRGERVCESSVLEIAGAELRHAEVFGEVPAGEAFWYVNSIGLVEIACNAASAAARLKVAVGDAVSIAS